MNKNAIQKYAVWARNELIAQIKQRAFQYEITEHGYGEAEATVIAGYVLSEAERQQRAQFITLITRVGFEQAIEEVAYTWFNRFVALRFMEVNGFLPTHIRLFSDTSGAFGPEILKEVLHLDLPGLDQAQVAAYINDNAADELYRYLLLTQCNALNEAMPEMFGRLDRYTEMLLPNNILRQGSVLERLVTDIPEDDWRDAVQVIGWLYQYYNTEPKQAVFDGLKKNIKITKEKIPAATQLFTPDWIVRYMVENSLGRLWLEGHPDDELLSNWRYYLPDPEQTPEVEAAIDKIRRLTRNIKPEEIKFIDPCMGSGHILVYAFEVLMQIYRSEGYADRDAAKLILEKNLYGLDIDRRAHQLAYFALMMKARQYNRRIFSEGVKPQVYHPGGWPDGEEYGSLIVVDREQWIVDRNEPERFLADGKTHNPTYEVELRVWSFKRLLSQKYEVVVTNPPYMGGKGQSAKISEFLAKKYADVKSDTFSAFIVRCCNMTKTNGYVGMFTPYVCMFIQSYEKLRKLIYSTWPINSLIQFEYSAFEEATVPVCTFVLRNNKTLTDGQYLRFVNFRGGMEVQRQKYLEAITNPRCGFRYTADSDNFAKIPGNPVAYWLSAKMIQPFETGRKLGSITEVKSGLSTTNNDLFLKHWYEVSFCSIVFDANSIKETESRNEKWYPIAKGGDYRKWYGNNDYVVNWQNDGRDIRYATKGAAGGRVVSPEYYFRQLITWSGISSGLPSMRISRNAVFGSGAKALTPSDDLLYYLAFLNSSVAYKYLQAISPTLNYEAGHIASLPILGQVNEQIETYAGANTNLTRADWDAFETSWDFKRHPLVHGVYDSTRKLEMTSAEQGVEAAYVAWQRECEERFATLKANEEELNRIFIDIYGLQDELTPEVEDKDVTVRRIYDTKNDIPESMKGNNYVLTKADVLKSLLSYAVGCIFGRYSLYKDGLAYAGGEWRDEDYRPTGANPYFKPDSDRIIPICDDVYFEDDIVERVVDFMRVVYGNETLENNLLYLAESLYPNTIGAAREKIRRYFLNDFYKDHCKIYKKRPIYWLFDSGKKNGFKALIYLHRYSRDLLARLRTDYVHEQQERYRTQLAHIAEAMQTAQGAERARLLKQQNKLTEQLKEISAYEEKVHHLADMRIEIDLDDGVKHNYQIFADVLAKI